MKVSLIIAKLYLVSLLVYTPAAVKLQNNNNPSTTTYLLIAKRFLSAKEKSFQQTATKQDVEAVLNFCSDTVKYDHVLSPEKKFSFSGKTLWREGATSHLGETRNVKLEIIKIIARQNIVVIDFTLSREYKAKGSWQRSKETTVSLIEFNKDKKIAKLTDYL